MAEGTFFEAVYDRKNGLYYYLLPEGTTLYRGDSSITNSEMILEDTQTFFGFTHENVEASYGTTFEFKTNKELRLIALDKNKGTPFYEGLNKENKSILNKNYGYTHPNGERESVGLRDRAISSFICENYSSEYHGYACDIMNTAAGGKFHSEAMICNPAAHLDFVKRVTDDETMEQLNANYKLRKAAPPSKKRPTLRRNYYDDEKEEEESPRKLGRRNSLFDYDNEETPRKPRKGLFDEEDDDKKTPLGRSLFGGGNKKKRKTHKKKTRRRKTMKTRKQNKRSNKR